MGLTFLGINSKEALLTNLNTFGLYFENLVIKDLMVFCENYSATYISIEMKKEMKLMQLYICLMAIDFQ